jgi:rhamnogalacturonan endolyase
MGKPGPGESPQPVKHNGFVPLSRRRFLGGAAGAGGLVAALGVIGAGELKLAAPARAATAFGYTSSGGYFTVNTGAGLTYMINQSDGDMTSLVYNGVQLQDQSSFSQVESGLGAGASVTAYQSGDYIVITESVTDWYGSGTLYHYLVAVSGQNNIYMATYVNSLGAGELRWISRLNADVITTVLTPAEIEGGTAIESTDIYLLDGQTRSKYYSNRQAMDLTVRGITGSGIGVYMAYGNRESSAGGPFFRDIEQQGTTDNQLYNYLWSAHNQTEAQRLDVLYGPYALMISDETTPAAPDMSFMYDFGFEGTVTAAERGYVVGGAYGATSGTTVTVGWANSTAQYWASTDSNSDYSSPAMQPGTYTMTMYQDELAVATQDVTVTAGSTLTGQNLNSSWDTPADPVFRIGAWTGSPDGFLNWDNLTWMHPSDARMASWGPVTYTVGSSSADQFPAYQFMLVNNPTTVLFDLTSDQIADRTVRIGITAAYAGGRPQIAINGWTGPVDSPTTQPDSRSLTIGTYRGNNTLLTFAVPSTAFVAGSNTMTITVISGSASLSDWLSPSYSYDCVEMY